MRRLMILALMAILPLAVRAEVKLPAVLGSGMVLQRNTEVNLWGTADGKTVTVVTSWNNAKYKVNPDENGAWKLKVSTGEAGGPYTITFIDGKSKTVLDNILLVAELTVDHADISSAVHKVSCVSCDTDDAALVRRWNNLNIIEFDVAATLSDHTHTAAVPDVHVVDIDTGTV